MEKNGNKAALVLKYTKRRYDGGIEVEMIRTIEQQVAARASQGQTVEATLLEAGPVQGMASPDVSAEPVIAPSPSTRQSKVLHALVLGPVEICIGLVGMMTATLAIVTFHRMKNEPLRQQGQTLLSDCFQTFRKGLLDSVTTPVRVFRAASARMDPAG